MFFLKIKYLAENWKLVVHLMFRTKRFGVNNQWWASFDSMWGYSFLGKVRHVLSIKSLVNEYQMMRFRATACHFIPDDEKEIMGWK